VPLTPSLLITLRIKPTSKLLDQVRVRPLLHVTVKTTIPSPDSIIIAVLNEPAELAAA
jgi:hypothetical protein